MNAHAIVPVKRFGAAKQRLAGSLAPSQRGELAAAMLGDVVAALLQAARLAAITIVSGDPRAAEIARDGGLEWLDDPGDAGHSEAAMLGITHALAAKAETVALLPGDCPLVDPGEIDRALAALPTPGCGVVPDRHGTGTNALVLSPPDVMRPAFGPGSHARHLRLAAEAGIEGRTLPLRSLALDLDTPDDLLELKAAVAAEPESAPLTTAALEALVA